MSTLDSRLSKAVILASALFINEGCNAEQESPQAGTRVPNQASDLSQHNLPFRDKFFVSAEEFVDSFDKLPLSFENRRQVVPTVFKVTSVAPHFSSFCGFSDTTRGEIIGGRRHGDRVDLGAWKQSGFLVQIEISNSYGKFISMTASPSKYKFEATDIDLPPGLKVAGAYFTFDDRFTDEKLSPAPEASLMPQPLILGPHPLYSRTRQVLFHTESEATLPDSQLVDFAAIENNKLTLTLNSDQFLGAPLPIILSGLGLSTDTKQGPVANTAEIGVLLVPCTKPTAPFEEPAK